MNAHWVKWVSVLSLALAGTLAACSVSSDDDDDDNNNTSGNGGRGGNAGSGNVSGSGGGGVGGSGGGGGNPPAASPPRDRANVIAALNARKYDPEGGDATQNAAVAAKWACESEPVDPQPESAGKHGVFDEGEQNRTCANFQLAGAIFDDCGEAGFNPNSAAAKEVLDSDGNIVAWAWYVKDENQGYYWFRADATTNDEGETVVDEATINEGFGLKVCQDCHSGGETEYVWKGSTIDRGDPDPLMPPTPERCGIPEPG